MVYHISVPPPPSARENMLDIFALEIHIQYFQIILFIVFYIHTVPDPFVLFPSIYPVFALGKVNSRKLLADLDFVQVTNIIRFRMS
jgi:hypothetical protein